MSTLNYSLNESGNEPTQGGPGSGGRSSFPDLGCMGWALVIFIIFVLVMIITGNASWDSGTTP